MNNTATYCPEDDKLRLYVGRVPREDYERLRAQGWQPLHKQRETGGGDFAAGWTPEREDTALEYAGGIIEDEDKGPAERAADRAERFAGYRDKREGEAMERADTYAAGPRLLGYQSAALAERKARQLDRVADRAVNAWDKAEYWQTRTAGVIGHALHVAAPGVRMGRIKKIEAEIRKIEKDSTDATIKSQLIWDIWNSIAGNSKLIVLRACGYALQNAEIKPAGEGERYTVDQCRLGMALMMVNNVHAEYGSERYKTQKTTLAQLANGTLTPEAAAKEWLSNHPERPADWNGEGRWINHLRLRLAYENQMLEAQGGRLASVEMEPGGWIGKHQVQKVNKSPATGRVVSVQVWGTTRGYTKESGYKQEETRPCLITLETERLPPNAYRAPTPEEKAEFDAARKAEKKAKAERTPKGAPLINPTDEDAERLQAVLNNASKAVSDARQVKAYGKIYTEYKPSTVFPMTQAQYSDYSKGTYGHGETRGVCRGGRA
ncbi:MAG: DUF3560 domain-containing protein [FCB group bacterium]|jgi:hypothetical protein|nr:DUF3560 domain-containing protein [FCB group bacterium]